MELGIHLKTLVGSLGYVAALSFATLGIMFSRRVAALKAKEIRLRQFRTYEDEGSMPSRVLQASRHYQNLFEMPTLFCVVCLLALTLGVADVFTSLFAVGFCALRTLHAYIHIGNNNVIFRMRAFAGSLLFLLFFWLYVLGKVFL